MRKKRLEALAVLSALMLPSVASQMASAQVARGMEIAPSVERAIQTPIPQPLQRHVQFHTNSTGNRPEQFEQLEYTEEDKEFDRDLTKLYRRIGVSSLRFNFNSNGAFNGPDSEEIAKFAQADEQSGQFFLAANEYLRAAQDPLLFGDLAQGSAYVDHALKLARKLPLAERKRVLNIMILMCKIGSRFQSNDPGIGTAYLLNQVIEERHELKMPDDATTISLLRMLGATYERQQRYVELEAIDKRIIEIARQMVTDKPEEMQTAIIELAHVYKLQNELNKAVQTLTDYLAQREREVGKNSADLLPLLTHLITLHMELKSDKQAVDTLVARIVDISNNYEPDATRDLNNNNVIDPKITEAQNSIEQLVRSWQWYSSQRPSLDARATERLSKALYKLRLSTLGLDQWQTINTLSELCRFLNAHGKAAESKALAEDAFAAVRTGQNFGMQATQIATIIRDAQMSIDHVDPNTAPPVAMAVPSLPGMPRLINRQSLSVEQAQTNLDKLQKEGSRDLDAILRARTDLAYAFTSRNQRNEAQIEFRKAVTTYTESPGKGDSADLLWTVAEFFINRTPSYEEEKTFSQLLQTGYRRAASGNPPEWLNTATSSLSSYYTRTQHPAQAAQTLETCLSYIDKVEAVADKVKEPLLRQICTLQENQQEYAGALKTAEELLPIVERLHGANSAELSQWLVSLARLDARVNKLDEANKNIDKAIAIETKRPHRTLSYNYNSICNSISNVTNDLLNADKLEDADRLLRHAFKLVERQNAADENWVRGSASTLFWKYQAKREYEKEEATLEWIIKTRTEDLGDKDVRSNYYRTLLATAYLTHASDIKEQNPAQAQILYDKSTKVFGEAMTSYQHIMGPKALDLINAVTARAQTLDGIGKRDEAAALRRDFHLEANVLNQTIMQSFPYDRRPPNF